MRLSAFNVYVADHPEPGDTLIHNTFTGAFVPVGADMLAALRQVDAGAPIGDRDGLDDYLDPAVGVLVESRAAEERLFRAWYERHRSSPDTMQVVVSTTFACNLDCSYCLQADVLDGRTIKTDTAVTTGKWLAERAVAIGAKVLDLVFVGGEPLLHPGRIELILAEARRLCDPAEIAVKFRLITNGVFLTPELVDRWVPLGLTVAQVTLDGDETTHSITRRSKKRSEDSFAVIFANLVAAGDKIDVFVNGNYQTDTAHGFVPLIGKLRAAGLKSGTKMRFSPAIAGLGVPAESGLSACTVGGSNPELMLQFTDEILRAGFDPDRDALYKIGPCGFHLRHYYAIDPDGYLYKCPGFLGKQEWAIGHVSTGLTARYDGMVNLNPQRACGDCSHRPGCVGGCVAAEWTQKGIVEGVNCEIGYFESQKDELLKRKFALETSASVDEALTRFPARTITSPIHPAAPVVVRDHRVSLRVLAA